MKYRGRKSLRMLCAVLAGSLFLAACSKTETTEKKKEGKSEAETSAPFESTEESGKKGSSAGPDDSYHIDAELWSGDIPNHFKCIRDESIDTEKESYFAFYGDPNHPDYDYVILSIETEDASAFREKYQHYISLIDYAEGNLPTTDIGGYGFIEYTAPHFGTEIDITETCYLYRHEEASMTVRITFGDWVEIGSFSGWEILDGIEFSLPDLGLSDPPFSFEEGEHRSVVKEMPLSQYTVTPVQGHFSEHVYITSGGGVVRFSSTATHAAASEKYLYTYRRTDSTLFVYQINGEEMTMVTSFTVGNETTTVDLLDEDTLTVYPDPESDDQFFLVEKGSEGEKVLSCLLDVAVSPDGKNILCYNVRADRIHTLHLDPDTKTVTAEPFPLELPIGECELDSVFITQDSLYARVRARGDDTSTHVFEYDRDGHFIREIKDESQTDLYLEAVYDFGDGLLMVDAWEEAIELWDKDGHFISGVTLYELLGFSEEEVPYPHYSFLRCGESGDFILLFAYNNGGILEDLVYRIHIG